MIRYFLHIIYIVKLLWTFLIAHFITVVDAFVAIITMTFAFDTLDDLAKTSVGVLQDPYTRDDPTEISVGDSRNPGSF